ncbi:hypothetical protein QWY74_12545 [Halomonas almeriensis]|uniref:hypothetical protein n=1 Tax=Halomonas almeriensis TaxID=308163 RepID=UPI0025B28A68|nr:hypothetical protein [Halomonas almeriensis]MDN3554275.1 hypothetical protein [Halomonas almeriensis]
MRPVTFLARGLLAGLLAWLLVAPALATSYNIRDAQPHGDWHSLRLTLGEERHVRAIEQSSYSDSVLSVNATPGACGQRWLEIRVMLDEVQAESTTWDRVPVDVMIDQGDVYTGEAAFITERGDDGFYVRLTMPDTSALLDGMRHGETLRLRIHRAAEDYWFMVFSLKGADQALTRMNRLCETHPADNAAPHDNAPAGKPTRASSTTQ